MVEITLDAIGPGIDEEHADALAVDRSRAGTIRHLAGPGELNGLPGFRFTRFCWRAGAGKASR